MGWSVCGVGGLVCVCVGIESLYVCVVRVEHEPCLCVRGGWVWKVAGEGVEGVIVLNSHPPTHQTYPLALTCSAAVPPGPVCVRYGDETRMLCVSMDVTYEGTSDSRRSIPRAAL